MTIIRVKKRCNIRRTICYSAVHTHQDFSNVLWQNGGNITSREFYFLQKIYSETAQYQWFVCPMWLHSCWTFKLRAKGRLPQHRGGQRINIHKRAGVNKGVNFEFQSGIILSSSRHWNWSIASPLCCTNYIFNLSRDKNINLNSRFESRVLQTVLFLSA